MPNSKKEPSKFIFRVINRGEYIKDMSPFTEVMKMAMPDIPNDEQGIYLVFTSKKEEAKIYTDDEVNQMTGVNSLLDWFDRIEIN